jgi:hypothetical protein
MNRHLALKPVDDPILANANGTILVALRLVISLTILLALRHKLDRNGGCFDRPWQAAQARPNGSINTTTMRTDDNRFFRNRQI